jgi:N-acyl-D-amino-acid deacylase
MVSNFDMVIKGARVIDGTGNPWFKRDIGISQGRIKTLGQISTEAKEIINAEGLTVSPGFIDLHNHNDLSVLAYPNLESHLMQGITTSVIGNCGLSMAPIAPCNLALLRTYLSPFLKPSFDYGWDWQSTNDFYQKVEKQGITMNLAPLVGQGTIRLAVKGFDSSKPSTEEMLQMKKLLIQSLEEGVFGMSSGLFYPPGSYCSTEELIELASVLKNYGAIFTIHLRNESNKLIESLEEALKIAEENSIPLEISHHKAAGRLNWGKIRGSLKMMAKARRRGVEVNCDVYPYVAGSTMISSLLPTWVLEGGISRMLERLQTADVRKVIEGEIAEGTMEGENWIRNIGWENIIIGGCPVNKEYEGKSLEQILNEKGNTNTPYNTFFDWMVEISGEAIMILFGMDEDDVKAVISSPLSSIITDAWATSPCDGGKPHPRAYGSFPRVIRKYVREEKILTLDEALRKMTSLPAMKVGLKDRGIVREGFWADLLIFDAEKISDLASFSNPHQYPEGIKKIIVNGQVVAEDSKLTGVKPGRVLSR